MVYATHLQDLHPVAQGAGLVQCIEEAIKIVFRLLREGAVRI